MWLVGGHRRAQHETDMTTAGIYGKKGFIWVFNSGYFPIFGKGKAVALIFQVIVILASIEVT